MNGPGTIWRSCFLEQNALESEDGPDQKPASEDVSDQGHALRDLVMVEIG